MIDEFEGKVIAEKYRIESILRDSDLGVFYRAWHVLMDKPVTLKILAPALAIDKRFVERFLAEAKAASQAAHPNVLNVTDFGTDARGISYTVYEGTSGETLRNLIVPDDALPTAKALNIARQAAAGIAAAHAKGLIHGGLTPDKILMTTEGENVAVKVFDFGVQPIGWNSNADIEYLAPEQYTSTANADARSDIYALDVILYEMLAGVVPYSGKTMAELKAKQDADPPAPLSGFRDDLPADLEPMILSAVATDPVRRYQSMRAFAEDLELVSSGVAVLEARAAAAPRRNIWQTAFIVLVGIFLLAVALIYATSTKKTDPTTQLQADAGSLPVQPIGPATGAQEESLAKLPAMTDAEVLAAANSNTAVVPGQLPGGDGFNAWANGGIPPPGAPLNQVVPGGQMLSGDPNTSSPFMPSLDLICKDVSTGKEIPCPTFTPAEKPLLKPSPAPKQPAANTAVGQPSPAATPKPNASPSKTPATAAQPNKDKTAPAKPPKGPEEDHS